MPVTSEYQKVTERDSLSEISVGLLGGSCQKYSDINQKKTEKKMFVFNI